MQTFLVLALAVALSLSLSDNACASCGAKPTSLRIPFSMPEIKAPSFPDRTVDICDYGAVGDGKKLNTAAFVAAVEACSKSGGGRVLVPAGTWLTGPIHLKSNIDLHLEKGAEIRFSTDFEDYLPTVFTRWEGMECCNYSPLIYVRDCSNVAVTGEGKLNGQGEAWWTAWNGLKKPAAQRLYEMVCSGVPVKDRVFDGRMRGLRPSFIQPVNCWNVLIEGVSIENGPMWTIHPVYSENVIVRKVSVKTTGPNTDGCVPDSCRNVVIEDSLFSTGDDCIVIKSGLNEDGWRVGRPSENIVIRHCRTERGHGGVVIGSEMSGGVRNILAHDCTFDGTEVGIRMKSRRGRGGVVENIWFQNITMTRIERTAVQVVTFYGSSTVQPRTEEPPAFRGIHIRNVTCQQADRAVEIAGLPEKPIKNVSVEDVTIRATRGLYCSDAKGVKLTNVNIARDKDPVMCLVNCRDVTIRGAKCADGTDVFLNVDGERTANVQLAGNDLSKAQTDVVLGEGVKPEAVVQE